MYNEVIDFRTVRHVLYIFK